MAGRVSPFSSPARGRTAGLIRNSEPQPGGVMVGEATKTVTTCALWAGATGGFAAGVLRADRDFFLLLAVVAAVLSILGVAADFLGGISAVASGGLPTAFPKVRLVMPERPLGGEHGLPPAFRPTLAARKLDPFSVTGPPVSRARVPHFGGKSSPERRK